jgi:hypothetical protein
MATKSKRAAAKPRAKAGTKKGKKGKKAAVQPKAASSAPRTRGAAVAAAADDSAGGDDQRTIEIRRAGPIPVMRIEVTQLQLGQYSVSLWDANGMNPKEIARGTNDDDINDEFDVVKTPAELGQLDRCTMFWVVWIKALQFGPGSRYFVRVRMTQGDEEVVTFERQGPLTKKFLPFHGEWRLRLV